MSQNNINSIQKKSKWKKVLSLMLIPVVAVAIGTGIACDIDENAMLQVTKTSGLLATTTWFAFDNPEQEVKDGVSKLISDIETSYDRMESGETYLDVVYPQLVLKIDQDSSIKEQYKNAIKGGCIIILSGLDELMAMNPNLRENRDLARQYVTAFCDGAKEGLLLNANNSSLQRASKAYSLRMQLSRK